MAKWHVLRSGCAGINTNCRSLCELLELGGKRVLILTGFCCPSSATIVHSAMALTARVVPRECAADLKTTSAVGGTTLKSALSNWSVVYPAQSWQALTDPTSPSQGGHGFPSHQPTLSQTRNPSGHRSHPLRLHAMQICAQALYGRLCSRQSKCPWLCDVNTISVNFLYTQLITPHTPRIPVE